MAPRRHRTEWKILARRYARERDALREVLEILAAELGNAVPGTYDDKLRSIARRALGK